MSKRILFLTHNGNDFFCKKIKNQNIDIQQIYWQKKNIFKLLRRIHLKVGVPFLSMWIGKWKKNLNKYDLVIIPASVIIVPVVKYINKINPNLRVIVWFANPVSKRYRIKPYRRFNCELWSFDMENCIQYNLYYNSQYYFNNIILPKNKIVIDVLFVGADKGRLNKLIDIKNKLNKLGMKTYFHITSTSREESKNTIYKNRISYEKILEYISKSIAILDIIQDNQSGLTLRPLEALFFSKKLITNNKNIINCNFYNRNNIFILGIDNINKLPDFVKSPYIPISKKIIEYYNFNNWILRFIRKGELS